VKRNAKECVICGRGLRLVAGRLGLCLRCIRAEPERALEHAQAVHAAVRERFGQVARVPRAPQGVTCPLCARACRIEQGGRGFCGLRTASAGRLRHLAGDARRALLHWYRDPLPTNCVADFVCKGHQRRGQHNLAVFFGACTLNCLYCQNWSYRHLSVRADPLLSPDDLAAVANSGTHCVCYFGGDPSAQLPFALAASRRLAQRGAAICFETNGLGNQKLMRQAARLSGQTRGTIKFDLKAIDPVLHRVLTSADNEQVLRNFEQVAEILVARSEQPRLVAATLLVPGYVDVAEVRRIAAFVARVSPSIPYSLLAFHPQFQMQDLPRTSRAHAEAAAQAAREAGLKTVRVGNTHLLSNAYDADDPAWQA
jgi:pyruvate formate lyase activating enzyme